jgi:hypothetical protein
MRFVYLAKLSVVSNALCFFELPIYGTSATKCAETIDFSAVENDWRVLSLQIEGKFFFLGGIILPENKNTIIMKIDSFISKRDVFQKSRSRESYSNNNTYAINPTDGTKYYEHCCSILMNPKF